MFAASTTTCLFPFLCCNIPIVYTIFVELLLFQKQNITYRKTNTFCAKNRFMATFLFTYLCKKMLILDFFYYKSVPNTLSPKFEYLKFCMKLEKCLRSQTEFVNSTVREETFFGFSAELKKPLLFFRKSF